VVGRVLSFETETHSNGKSIRWCRVDVGPEHNEAGADGADDGESGRGIVCGAHNFAVDDLVVVALPGAVLPGGFAISARTTYGHVSDGMICSVRELGIGDDHAAILVLAPDAGRPGQDARDVLALHDAILDIAVTPDRGYCLSVRGLARESAAAFDAPFRDVIASAAPVDGRAYSVVVDDPTRCDQFSARAVTQLDAMATTPEWLRNRLRAAGMRPISLPVDVTNYVMF
jgi:phenylalanyl-tRNA synthetase beta chain